MRRLLLLGSVFTLGCRAFLGLDLEYESAEEANSGGASSGTESSASVGGAGGEGGTSGEDCTDGVDNDGDMQADCADTDCQPDYECVDPVPSGFTKHVRMYTGPEGGGDTKCPGGAAPVTYFVGPAQSGECTACSCTWSGASCTSPEVSCYFSTSTCAGAAEYQKKGSDLTCDGNPDLPSNLASCKLTGGPEIVDKGSCLPSVPTPVGSPLWDGTVDVCPISVSGAGCTAGQVCLPKISDDFNSLCIESEAEVPCPESWTAVDVQAYEGGTDNRACSPCNCDVETVKCEGGYYIVYDGDSCMSSKVNIQSSDCVDVSTYLDSDSGAFRPVPATPTQGTCSGGQPMGKVEPEKPHKICCQ